MATISIADNDARIQHSIGSGGNVANSTTFTIDFPFFDLDDINVIITDSLGNDTSLTRGTGVNTFAVTGTAVDDGFSGGNITLGSVYTSVTVTVFRDIPVTRTTDFATSGPFNIAALNTELDRIVAIQQELETNISRALILPATDPLAGIVFPNSTTRASKFLAFDANGNAIAASTGSWQGDWGASRTYALGDIVKDTSTGSIYIANASHTSSGSQPLTTNTDAAKWDQMVDISTVTTAETNAGNSATAAGNSATAAAASATDAAFSDDWAVKTDGIVDDGTTQDYSSKAYAVGGTGVTDSAGRGSAKEWATDTLNTCDGTEYSSKEYAIGTGDNSGMNTGSSKQWSLGGGTGFDRDTAVTGSGLTAEYSARYYANQAKNNVQGFVDVYYGSFASDTAAEDYQINDNEGSVNVGDLYFNSSDNVMRVRSFSGWNDVAADTTTFATNGFAIAMAIAL